MRWAVLFCSKAEKRSGPWNVCFGLGTMECFFLFESAVFLRNGYTWIRPSFRYPSHIAETRWHFFFPTPEGVSCRGGMRGHDCKVGEVKRLTLVRGAGQPKRSVAGWGAGVLVHLCASSSGAHVPPQAGK